MTDSTRAQFIIAATQLFADRGFYGVSIAAIADELGLTKQALLHHFGSKERLYAEVLKSLGERLVAAIDGQDDGDPAACLENFFVDLGSTQAMNHADQCLVIRELMDNRARLQSAENWYLKPFLDRLVDLYRQIPGHAERSDMDALAVIYHLIGSVSYFEISRGTLNHMYGDAAYKALEQAQPSAFRLLVQQTLKQSSSA